MSAASADLRYVVMVDDNFHPYDEEERYELARFATLDEAVAACRRHTLENLTEIWQPGMSAEDLFEHYKSFGEDPFIRDTVRSRVTDENRVPFFSAWRFAKETAPAVMQTKVASR